MPATAPPPVSRGDRQTILADVAAGLDDAARECARLLSELDSATAALRARGMTALGELDHAAAVIADARSKLHKAHAAVCGVATA